MTDVSTEGGVALGLGESVLPRREQPAIAAAAAAETPSRNDRRVTG
jgi:hypothetical protein